MKIFKYYLIALIIIIIDQTVKLLVYHYMDLGRYGEISIFGDWFKLHYTLNPGMAFGIKFDSQYGKLALTLFRWVMMIVIVYYVWFLVKKHVHSGFIYCIALILGGAVGNVIDSTFYGVYLDNAPVVESPPPPLFYPWFHGQVIDMFFFDIWEGTIPQWIPFVGGHYYSLWPIFNIADASIFTGVTIILAFQRKFFPKQVPLSQKENEVTVEP